MNETIQIFLRREVAPALANLDVCRRVCALLKDYAVNKLPPPRAEVRFFGQGDQPAVVGKNCGFFVSPVIFTAIIDIRRFVSFFGYKVTAKGEIDRRHKNKEDFDISDLALPYPSREKLLGVLTGESVTPAQLEKALVEALTYANKTIAHFTQVSPSDGVDYNYIVLASFGIDRAMRSLIYESLQLPYPDLQIKSDED